MNAVSEQGLDGTDVGAYVEQMRGEGSWEIKRKCRTAVAEPSPPRHSARGIRC